MRIEECPPILGGIECMEVTTLAPLAVVRTFAIGLTESDDGIWTTDLNPKGGLKLPRYCNVKLLARDRAGSMYAKSLYMVPHG